MKPIKPLERDRSGVLIPAGAFDSLMANDAAWRALLRLPVGYSVKRPSEREWWVLDGAGMVKFQWTDPATAIMEVVGYDE
jgi:hypothetical protein